MASVEYRPVPGWPDHRVGSDGSVWVRIRQREETWTRRKLTAEAVAEIRRLRAEGFTHLELAARFGVTLDMIHRVMRGSSWSSRAAEAADRWRRLETFTRRCGPAVRLYDGAGRVHVRVVSVLYAAAFNPSSVHPAWLARLGPRPPRPAPIPRSARPPLPPTPERPIESAIAAAEVLELPADDLVELEPPPPAPPPVILDDDEPDDDVRHYRRGQYHGRARMDDRRVREARLLHSAGFGLEALAERYGVHKQTMFNIVSGRTWTHLPMPEPRRRLATGRKSSSQQVRDLAAGGLDVSAIAVELGISESTVRGISESTVRRYLD